MRKSLVLIVLLFTASLVAVGSSSAVAFELSGAGASLGYTSPEDLDGTFNVGGHMEFEQPGTRFHLMPGIRYWKTNGVSDLGFDADVLYHFDPDRNVSPYLGAGLGVHVASSDATDDSDTSLGPNLFGGVRFPASFGHTFAEARFTLTEISQFSVLGGMTWHLR